MHAAGAALDYEPDMMACLAECLERSGRHGEALSTAKRTIGLSRNRSARLPECRALIVAGNALANQVGAPSRDEAERYFSQAEALMKQTGAMILERHLRAGRGRSDVNPAAAATGSDRE